MEDHRDKICWVYVDGEPLNSYKENLSKMQNKEIEDKESSLNACLTSIINDESYPNDLMIKVIHNMTIIDDIRLKKLLFLFWEVIEKKNNKNELREEFLLVCNSLRKDLIHPNEYVRGRTLRLVSKLPYNEIFESLRSVIFENLSHKHHYVRRNALICIISMIDNFGADSLPNELVVKLKELIENDMDISTRRNAYLALAQVDNKESILITRDLILNNEVNELGDLIILAMIENLKYNFL